MVEVAASQRGADSHSSPGPLVFTFLLPGPTDRSGGPLNLASLSRLSTSLPPVSRGFPFSGSLNFGWAIVSGDANRKLFPFLAALSSRALSFSTPIGAYFCTPFFSSSHCWFLILCALSTTEASNFSRCPPLRFPPVDQIAANPGLQVINPPLR